MTSGMKWADIGPGSYIKWVDKDQTKHGLVIKKLSDSFSVRENGEKTVISVKFADAQLSRSSAIGGKFMANLREVGENTLVNGLFLRIIYGRDFFGSQSMSFFCSDALYELLLKDALAPISNYLAVPVSEGEKSFFDSNDFKDLIRKLPFTFLGQCLFQRLIQKKKFFAHSFEHIIAQSTAILSTNLIDRYVIADKGTYYYP
jgi:hypothetical protein